MKTAALAAFLVVAALAVGCTGSATTPSETPAFSQTDLVVGTGPAVVTGHTITVDYAGWLYDPSKADSKGLPFDSSTGFSFVLGTGQVIQGWDKGLPGANVGGVRRLVIPPSLAYGSARNGLIPPNASLVFDIKITDVQ